MRPLERVRHLDRRVRWALAGIALLVGLNLFTLVLEALYGGGATGPPSSSYATAGEGSAGWARLLQRFGHPVERLREPPSEAELTAGSTVVVLDPAAVLPPDTRSLRAFVHGGGRLIIGGRGPQPWLGDLVDSPPQWGEEGLPTARPASEDPEVEGISAVSSAGIGAWVDAGAAEPLLGNGPVIAAAMDAGDGRIIFLADPSVVDNDHLPTADNAAFALALAGEQDRPVAFAETFHGYGERSGLEVLPVRARWVLGGLALAALLWIVARGRRLGPPEQTARRHPPARLAYVEAVAGGVARSRQRAEAIEPLREEVIEMMERRGLVSDREADSLLAAARQTGLDDDTAKALVAGPSDDEEVLRVGAAFARLSKGAR